jgi:ATP-dependent Clp protease ATP-binding subunit ClpC
MTEDNFTAHARQIVVNARDHALQRNHEYVGTEHLLLALIAHDDGVAAEALRNLNVDLDEIRETIDGVVPNGKSAPGTPDLPFTTRTKKILELAAAEAQDFGRSHVDTEHLLLGMIREGGGIAAQVLERAGLTEEVARAEVRRLLGVEPNAMPDVSDVIIEVRLRNGARRRHDSTTIAGAIEFLKQLSY